MSAGDYTATEQQATIIGHDGDAFVKACPGAGKTRTMVERARAVLADGEDQRSIAFLSFTNAAVDELSARLVSSGAMTAHSYPNYIGTFDGFLWQFLIAPFGIEGCDKAPRLVPDKKEWEVKPNFKAARALTLDFFDRTTGKLIQAKADAVGFTPAKGPRAWETVASSMIHKSLADGQLDFEDVRHCVQKRLRDAEFSSTLGKALAGRFREIIVDEAQDCNRVDLEIITWLRKAGIAIKIICDPNQGIYGFRGGVTDELEQFGTSFLEECHLPMSGNFRSSPAICAAISQLRPPASRGLADKALGKYKLEAAKVHLLSYGGASVPASIGSAFQEIAAGLGIAPRDAPIVAATWRSANSAAGRRNVDATNDKTLVLAQAVMGFHTAFDAGHRRSALARLHKSVLHIQGHISSLGDYSKHLEALADDVDAWRTEIIGIGQRLKPGITEGADDWLARARSELGQNLVGGASIGQRMKSNAKLGELLSFSQGSDLPARAIHAVKGLEFPAVCVVLTPQTAKKILEVLEGSNTAAEAVEDARKIYVGASRAERLLVIATPKSQVGRLKVHLERGGTGVTHSEI